MKKISYFISQHKFLSIAIDYANLLIGCFIVAVSFNILLLPNKIASGGVVGLSIIIKDFFGFNPAYTQWLINFPIFIAGVIILGSQSAVKDIIGTFALPFFILITQSMTAWTHNPLLAALYGGLGLGLGLGLVFRSKGSIGGFSIIALIIERYTSITIGAASMVMDGFVIILAGVVFKPENALYALIVVFIMSRAIDLIQLGFNFSKMILVFSDAQDHITNEVLNLPRGVTKLHATGGYSNQERPVLLIVVDRSEVTRVKRLIQIIDPNAFFVISNAHEVIGMGFSKDRPA